MATTLLINKLEKFLFLIKLLKFLNLFSLRPINSAGNMPTSERTEYLPPMKFLCSIISALSLFAS